MVSIRWNGEDLHLLPERAVFWPRPSKGGSGGGVLVVADLHLGKSASFRAAGVPVPEVIDADLQDLSVLIDRHSPGTVVFAGDLLHARSGRTDAVFEPMCRWRQHHAHLDFVLVRGNHDRRSGNPPAAAGFRVVEEPFCLSPDDPIGFAHDPDAPHPGRGPVICGHLHPSAAITDGYSGLRAPCFWVRPAELVLPAFGRFTGTKTVRARVGDRVFLIGDGEVAEARPITVTPRPRASNQAARSAH